MPAGTGFRRKKKALVENAFTIFQPDFGTSPVADSGSDTITFTSSDSSITITGTAATDTLDFVVNTSAADVKVKVSSNDTTNDFLFNKVTTGRGITPVEVNDGGDEDVKFDLPTTTKGDLIVDNGTTAVRLPVGTNNQVLTADSAEATGVKWTAPGASPGFTWGRSGDIIASTFLLNDTVPSNVAGRVIPITGEITEIFVANENVNTFDVQIIKRPSTVLATVSVVAARSKTSSFTGVSVTSGDELQAKISTGTCRNVIVGVIIKVT